MKDDYIVRKEENKKIIYIRLHNIWFNFMQSMARIMWDDNSGDGLSLIKDVQNVILVEEINHIELNRLFMEGLTSMFLGEALRELDTDYENNRYEIRIINGQEEIVIPHINVVF